MEKMNGKICLREECDNPLNTGKFYCSTECSAIVREERKRNGHKPRKAPPALVRQLIPDPVVTLLTDRIGDGAYEVLDEMAVTMLEDSPPAPPLSGSTEGDFSYSYWVGGEDRRPSDALDFKVIEEMMKCGPVAFILEMKLAALMSVWRNDRSWKVISPDKELTEVATENLRQIMPMAALNFLRPALAYGASFNELVWEYKTAYELGLSKSRSAQKTYAVLKLPRDCNPETIDRIQRTSDGSFNGFVQRARLDITKFEHKVSADQALIIPYKMQFRNLWGESYLKPMYPIWFWYEVALRSWVRYLERMGTPVAVCYAPSRAKVRKPGESTLVDAMTWGLAVAGNIAKSNAASLPSDTDPQTNQPLWRLEYLTAEDRGTVFKDALEVLMRLLTQAGLSAELAYSRPSGGTGSYNLGETHAAQTAVHNELIFIEHLWALNTWLMPKYSLYNRGQMGPPIRLETEGLDPREQEHLFKLAGLAGNSQSFQDAIMMVDWRTLYEENNVPTLTEKEMQQLKEKLQEEALKKQKDFIKAQAQAGGPPGAGQRPDFAKENEAKEKKTPEARAASDEAKKLENLAFLIANGEQTPFIMTDNQMQQLLNLRRAGSDLIISTEGDLTPFDETQSLFNPFHDPKTGKFAKRRGGGAGGAAGAGKKRGGAGGVSGGDGAKPKAGSFLSTTGKLLGLAGLGALALVVIGAAGPSDLDKMQEEREERAEKVQAELDELTKDWPKFENEQQAMDELVRRLKAAGVQLPDDLKLDTDSSKMRAGAAGSYDKDSNTIHILPGMAEDIKKGSPVGIEVLMHELAHSAQEVDTRNGFGSWADAGLVQDDTNEARFRDYFEGQNDLVSMGQTSAMYGKAMDNDTMRDLHNSREELERKKRAMEGTHLTGAARIFLDFGYNAQAATYAGMMTAKGGDRWGNLHESHSSGFDQSTHYEILQDLFPGQMSGYDEGYYPPYQVVLGWLGDEYDLDGYAELEDMLEEAAQ
jgi:hypothetical protein